MGGSPQGCGPDPKGGADVALGVRGADEDDDDDVDLVLRPGPASGTASRTDGPEAPLVMSQGAAGPFGAACARRWRPGSDFLGACGSWLWCDPYSTFRNGFSRRLQANQLTAKPVESMYIMFTYKTT